MLVSEQVIEWCERNAATLEGTSAIEILHAWEEFRARKAPHCPSCSCGMAPVTEKHFA